MMSVLPLFIASQLHWFGSVARDWKYVSPCAISYEKIVRDSFELNAPTFRKPGRCKCEEQIRRLIRPAIDPKE